MLRESLADLLWRPCRFTVVVNWHGSEGFAREREDDRHGTGGEWIAMVNSYMFFARRRLCMAEGMNARGGSRWRVHCTASTRFCGFSAHPAPNLGQPKEVGAEKGC